MFYLFIFILGAIVGSFLNVIILRLNSKEEIAVARSHCPHCRHDLAPKDLIPLFSFVALGGKCRYCRKKISWQYPLMEIITGLLFVLATYSVVGGLPKNLLWSSSLVFLPWLRNLIFISILIVIFVYDLKWQLILDKVTAPAIIFALLFNLWLGLGWKNLLGAAIVGLSVFLIQFVVSRGKWVGGGDLRLGALMGLMLGWPQIIVALFFAYIIGAIWSAPILIAKYVFGKKNLKSEVAFGTFLAVGTIVALLWGNGIISWYAGMF